jgi:hypothetical protein
LFILLFYIFQVLKRVMSVVACVKQIVYIIVLYITGAKEGDVSCCLCRVHCIYIPNPQLSHSTISLGLSEPSV